MINSYSRPSALMRNLASLQAALAMFALIAMSSPLMAYAQEVPPEGGDTAQEAPQEPICADDEEYNSETEACEKKEVAPDTLECEAGLTLNESGDACVEDKVEEPKEQSSGGGSSGPSDEDILDEEEAQDEWESALVEDDEAGTTMLRSFGFGVPKTQLTIQKELINDDGGVGEYEDFSITVTRHRIILPDQSETYTFDADGELKINVVPTLSFGPFHQYYSVEETDAEGYVTTYDNCEDLEFDLGDKQACVVTNDDVEPEGPRSCEIVSSETDFVLEKDANAVETWVHNAWADLVGGAWIWGDTEVLDPSETETQTFVKEFVVTGTPTLATIAVAADNGAVVKINGTTVITQDPDATNYDDPAEVADILDELIAGVNTIEIAVTNLEYATENPHTNPAGLNYKLTIEGADCEESEYTPEPEVPTATLHATKIVCESEEHLPNRSGGADITATSASDFLAEVNDGQEAPVCWLEQGWEFEWVTAEDDDTNPGNNVLGPVGGAWATFGLTDETGTASTEVPAGGKVWVREVMKEDYQEFSGGSDVSAEMWCGTDVLNYDNWDWIDPVNEDGHYYCVAFNALEEKGEQCVPGEKWADNVVSSEQGDRKDGSDVLPARSNADATLGANDSVFYSLGFGGSVVVSFDGYVTDEAGDDLVVYETTNGAYPLEKATVEVSQDGSEWEMLTEEAGNTSGGLTALDISETGLSWIRFVRIVDTSNPALHTNDADGFDLNAVKAVMSVCEEPEDICEPKAETILLSSDEDEGGLKTDDESGPASVVSWLHGSWLQEVGEWIWKDTSTSETDATNGTEETFTRTFSIEGTPKDSVLEIAADNKYEVWVNGDLLVADTGEFNYGATEEHEIPADMLAGGENTITFVITNIDHPTENTPETNPGGLLYKVTVNHDECDPYEPPVPTKASVSVTKIMCESEDYLPNMNGGADITGTTAINWLAEGDNSEHCWLQEGYEFQWAPNGTSDPEDNGTSPLGAPWTTFGPTNASGVVTTDLIVADVAGTIQVREVLKSGDQTFTGTDNAESAELFCASDVAGYDNWEWISNPVAGQTYHCVAFNANEDAENPNDNGPDYGTLVIEKVALGGDDVFSFTVDPEEGESFSMSVDTSEEEEDSEQVEEGWYEVTEDGEEGWTLQGVSCEYGYESEGVEIKNGKSVYVAEGETVTCTFTNTKDGEQTETSNTTVVREADLADDITDAYLNADNWFFWNDEDNTVNNGLGSFVEGPETAVLGEGSAEMTVSGTQRRNIATYQFKDVPLADITELSFSTYSQSVGNGSPASERSAYLNFNVDFLNNDTWQRRLVFLPATNGLVANDEWQTWDAIDGGAALWLYSGALWPAGAVSNGSIPGTIARSWSDILADYPQAQTRSSDSWFGFRVGEPYADGFTGNVDNVVVGIKEGTNTHVETFDFEPTQTTPSNDGGSDGNTSSARRSVSSNSGQVLGASTECNPLLLAYLGRSYANPVEEVTKLQNFLNETEGAGIPVTGLFDSETEQAVRVFQAKYWEDVLKPWFAFPQFGVLDSDDTTGIVYKTTKWKVNELFCPGSEALPTLP